MNGFAVGVVSTPVESTGELAVTLSVVAAVVGFVVLLSIPIRAARERVRTRPPGASPFKSVFAFFGSGAPGPAKRVSDRARLIEEKHAALAEIRALQREIASLQAAGRDTAMQQARLEKVQARQYQLRLAIDRAE